MELKFQITTGTPLDGYIKLPAQAFARSRTNHENKWALNGVVDAVRKQGASADSLVLTFDQSAWDYDVVAQIVVLRDQSPLPLRVEFPGLKGRKLTFDRHDITGRAVKEVVRPQMWGELTHDLISELIAAVDAKQQIQLSTERGTIDLSGLIRDARDRVDFGHGFVIDEEEGIPHEPQGWLYQLYPAIHTAGRRCTEVRWKKVKFENRQPTNEVVGRGIMYLPLHESGEREEAWLLEGRW